MRGKPLVPFAVIAIAGLLLMISLSFQGLGASKAEDGDVVEEVVEFDDPIAAGEELFNGSCIGCHAGIPLTGIADKYSHEEIVKIIETGNDPDGNDIAGMPGGLKKGVEAEAIATFLVEAYE